jgi:transglutaminase-like putative cysteine protease
MKKIFYAILILSLFLLHSCSEDHFLKDEIYRKQVHDQFLKRKDVAKNRSEALFSVFDNKDLTIQQREALEFLYAYMPLTDLADYDGEFFLKQVDAAFEARDYFDWGQKVPDDIFRHFVLVYRVNNEYLDTARLVFFDELKDRVKGMSMADAALEVNHWCHEKVTYRATDGRTSSPLALVKTSWGRCGEESVLTATALRAVGIPARQCYTPRWVHTDSNHAWVEVWIDGKWHFLGACEPEPELDVAWFTAPAKRAMMVHTNVFGLYNGTEENNLKTDLYSRINLLSNYADTRKVEAKIVNEQGQPVAGADVKYIVYNYSEFYPIAETKTDENGQTSLISGMGDILIWATNGKEYGYIKSTPDDKSVTVTLNRSDGDVYEETIEMNPPKEQPVKSVSEEKIKANAIRLAYEDSIRNAYMSTFADEAFCTSFAAETKLDKEKVSHFLTLAQGNWQEIAGFMKQKKDNPYLFPFLRSLLEKDLRDTPAAYLNDHMNNGLAYGVKKGTPEEFVATYILSPRIGLELITPWRSYAHSLITKDIAQSAQEDVKHIIDYVKNNIVINNDDNYYNCRITPRGVAELKIADRQSRDIFFVAACRSCGIPARIEVSTSKPQYYENGRWINVLFEADKQTSANPKGEVILRNARQNAVLPGYSTHYSIAKFENGDFHTLNFRNESALKSFPAKLMLDEGYYRFIVGSRANDGSVTSDIQYFKVGANSKKDIEIVLPIPEGKMQVMGIVDMNSIVTLADNNKKTLKELSGGKGLVLCFADPGKEPTKHILQDLPAQSAALDEWGGGILFMVPDDKVSVAFTPDAFKGLPAKTHWGTDYERALLNQAAGALQVDVQDNFPLTVYLNDNGGILYYSLGYRIGIGENLIRTIRTEDSTK